MHSFLVVLCAVCDDVVLKDRYSEQFVFYIVENLYSSVNFVWPFCDLFQLLSVEWAFYTTCCS